MIFTTRRNFLASFAAVTLAPLALRLPSWDGQWAAAFWDWFEERFLADIWPFRDRWNDPWAWEAASNFPQESANSGGVWEGPVSIMGGPS